MSTLFTPSLNSFEYVPPVHRPFTVLNLGLHRQKYKKRKRVAETHLSVTEVSFGGGLYFFRGANVSVTVNLRVY